MYVYMPLTETPDNTEYAGSNTNRNNGSHTWTVTSAYRQEGIFLLRIYDEF